jgi:hypothetical protein
MLMVIVHRAAVLADDENENAHALKALLTSLASKLSEAAELSPALKAFSMQLPSCGLSGASLQQLERLQSCGGADR